MQHLMFLFLNSVISDNFSPLYNYSTLSPPPKLAWPQIILEVSSDSTIVQGVWCHVYLVCKLTFLNYKSKSSLQKIWFSYFTKTFGNNHLTLSHSLCGMGVGCTFPWTTFFKTQEIFILPTFWNQNDPPYVTPKHAQSVHI